MIASLFHPTSYFGFFLFIMLTGCGLPLPEEVAIVLAGVLSAQGTFEWQWAFFACLAGALVGDSLMYLIGYFGGLRLLYAHPRFAKLLGAQREARFEQAIQRHAFKVMLLSRFMVGVRGPVYLAAGIVRLPFRIFIICDLICATLVVGFFFGMSYAFGPAVRDWIRSGEIWVTVVVLILVLGIGGLLYYRNRAMIYRAIFANDTTPTPEKSGVNAEEDERAVEEESSRDTELQSTRVEED